MIWMYLVTLVGFGCAIFCMAEMASMAPTSGGQVSFIFISIFSSSYGFADKSEKKRLICGNLVSLVCDDDDVYLIYTHPYVCAYLMLKQI